MRLIQPSSFRVSPQMPLGALMCLNYNIPALIFGAQHLERSSSSLMYTAEIFANDDEPISRKLSFSVLAEQSPVMSPLSKVNGSEHHCESVPPSCSRVFDSLAPKNKSPVRKLLNYTEFNSHESLSSFEQTPRTVGKLAEDWPTLDVCTPRRPVLDNENLMASPVRISPFRLALMPSSPTPTSIGPLAPPMLLEPPTQPPSSAKAIPDHQLNFDKSITSPESQQRQKRKIPGFMQATLSSKARAPSFTQATTSSKARTPPSLTQATASSKARTSGFMQATKSSKARISSFKKARRS